MMEESLLSIIVALDAKSQYDALKIVEQLDPTLCRVKVGKELFTHEGPSVVNFKNKTLKFFLILNFMIFQILPLRLFVQQLI